MGGGGITQNSVSQVPKKDWALVLWGFDWGLLGTWRLGLGLGLDNSESPESNNGPIFGLDLQGLGLLLVNYRA